MFTGKAAPKEIKHRYIVGFRGIRCEIGKRFTAFRSAVEQVVSDTLSVIPGCHYSDACQLSEIEISGCSRRGGHKKKRAVTKEKDVLLSLSINAVDSALITDDLEERSEAVIFQMEYAVSTGQFKISSHGVNGTANRSSLHHLSSDITCNPGFVLRSDLKGCGK